jgi:hypothetical protein
VELESELAAAAARQTDTATQLEAAAGRLSELLAERDRLAADASADLGRVAGEAAAAREDAAALRLQVCTCC